MQSLRKRIFTGLMSASLAMGFAQFATANENSTARMIRDALQPEGTKLDTVNDFISHSKQSSKIPAKKVVVEKGKIFAKLLTPLNSSFNLNGDDVRAIVVGSVSEKGKPWLEEGTILEGCVEASSKATFGQTDGSLVIRFYKAKLGEHQIELFTSSDTGDGAIRPSNEKITTKKQRIRGVLMTVSRIAIPAAIGTSGMSIAISAGAGAVIGCAFADKGKHIQGTVRGAWEGAGLTILDPLVCKGQSVVLPQGTPIQLQLSEAVSVPPYTPNLNKNIVSEELSGSLSSQRVVPSVTQLNTHAEILSNPKTSSTSNGDAQLIAVNRKISQNDLAGALIELTAAEELYPNDENVKKMHEELYTLISGGKKISDTGTGTSH